MLVQDSRPWVCLHLREWTLCVDPGHLNEIRDRITEEEQKQQQKTFQATGVVVPISSECNRDRLTRLTQIRTFREFFHRLLIFQDLESVDSIRRTNIRLSPLVAGADDLNGEDDQSGVVNLLSQCPRLKDLAVNFVFDRDTKCRIDRRFPRVNIFDREEDINGDEDPYGEYLTDEENSEEEHWLFEERRRFFEEEELWPYNIRDSDSD